ncbi:hypothetical protein PCL1606_52560 [Pseudomonas chlororaphis]|uniref:Uncharacterized protein n=1 Tax=Pseudomonas chlororaphis TaxID=587753 RepID=A0A0D5Y6W7_9PSED|nr:hypothetical protein PCL1606_52560 [Pseudomonas chlororaphis]
MQRHYIPVVVHPSLLKGIFCRAIKVGRRSQPSPGGYRYTPLQTGSRGSQKGRQSYGVNYKSDYLAKTTPCASRLCSGVASAPYSDLRPRPMTRGRRPNAGGGRWPPWVRPCHAPIIGPLCLWSPLCRIYASPT